MTMGANDCRTQIGNKDKTVVELLIAGFWDSIKDGEKYVTNQQIIEILDSIKIDEYNASILENLIIRCCCYISHIYNLLFCKISLSS